jgi:hypothetical protein
VKLGSLDRGHWHALDQDLIWSLAVIGSRVPFHLLAAPSWLHRHGYYRDPWLWSSLKFMFDKNGGRIPAIYVRKLASVTVLSAVA